MSLPKLSESEYLGNQITNPVFNSFAINAANSSAASPKIGGFTNLSSSNACRFFFGNPANSFQNSFGGRMQLQGYWGVEIYGNHRNSLGVDFTVGNGSDPCLNVIGTFPSTVPLCVTGALSQTANLTEWRIKDASTPQSVVTATGNLGVRNSAPGCALQVTGGVVVTSSGATSANPGAGNLAVGGITTSGSFRVSALNTTPASATAPGTAGEIRITNNAIYVCVATNQWLRSVLATF